VPLQLASKQSSKPAGKPAVVLTVTHLPAPRELRKRAEEIADLLSEARTTGQIVKIVSALGFEVTHRLALTALEIQAAGGEISVHRGRPRTVGGIFYKLIRQHAASLGPDVYYAAFPKANPTPPPRRLLWEERLGPIDRSRRQPGEAINVNITVIGKPGTVVKHKGVATAVVRGPSQAPSLPKQLPSVDPSGTEFTLQIPERQWNKIEAQLKAHPDDLIIAEGLPVLDPEAKAITVLVRSATTVMLKRAAKLAQAANAQTRPQPQDGDAKAAK
jgi:hypothetical protein